LRLTVQPNAITVPNAAVQNGQDGQFVYVVKQDRSVEARPVVASSRVGEDMVISQGLQPGEIVVTEGQLRLQPGSRVQMRDVARASNGNGAGAAAGDDSSKGSFKRADGSAPSGEGRGGEGRKGKGGKGGERFKKESFQEGYKAGVRGDGPGGDPTSN